MTRRELGVKQATGLVRPANAPKLPLRDAPEIGSELVEDGEVHRSRVEQRERRRCALLPPLAALGFAGLLESLGRLFGDIAEAFGH
jgi:hypothetical protein